MVTFKCVFSNFQLLIGHLQSNVIIYSTSYHGSWLQVFYVANKWPFEDIFVIVAGLI